MVQFNLLPDVKLEYQKAKRTKRMVMLASFTATGLAVFIIVLLFLIVNVFQKQHINNLNKDIQASTNQLKNVPELEKVLTVQNQLNSLTPLHESKPATNRLYDYLIRLTPKDAKISKVEIDYSQSSMIIEGVTNSLSTTNKFVDILKFTDYKNDNNQQKAFSDVVLSKYKVSGSDSTAGLVSYTIEFKFDNIIFDNTKKITLVVPNKISTRSATEAPTDLFAPNIVEDRRTQ